MLPGTPLDLRASKVNQNFGRKIHRGHGQFSMTKTIFLLGPETREYSIVLPAGRDSRDALKMPKSKFGLRSPLYLFKCLLDYI